MSAEEHLHYMYGGCVSEFDDPPGVYDFQPAVKKQSHVKNHRPYIETVKLVIDTFSNLTEQELIEEVPAMTTSSLIQRRIVEVKFDVRRTLSEQSYAYFTDIEDLKPGDYVVVVVGEVPKIAMVSKVRGISKSSQDKANKWIAFRVNLTDYYIKVKQDEVIRQIEEELDAEMQRINRIEVFRSCAENSPLMKSLLSKLKEINPDIKLLED